MPSKKSNKKSISTTKTKRTTKVTRTSNQRSTKKQPGLEKTELNRNEITALNAQENPRDMQPETQIEPEAPRGETELTPDLDQPLMGTDSGDSWDFQADRRVLDVLQETERVATDSENLAEQLHDYSAVSPIQSGGDVDADWERDESVGEEGVGGTVATPDQDRVDELGQAVGIEYQDEEPLHTEEKLENRDRHRWELNIASRDDEQQNP